MKKLFILALSMLLVFSLLFSLAACGEEETPDNENNESVGENPEEDEIPEGGETPDEDKPTNNEPEHTPGTAVEENRVEPTCTKDGSYDSVVYCSECNSELSRQKKFIVANGHNFMKNECLVCRVRASEGLEMTLSEDKTHYIVSGIGSCSDRDIIIPSNYNELPITVIGRGAFIGSNLTSVTIPNSVKTIKDYAFYECYSLSTLTLGNSITAIEANAFQDCNIANVTIPDSVETIESYAFATCKKLTNVVIQDGTNYISSKAFGGCDSLSSIIVSEDNTTYKSIDGNLYDKGGKTLIHYAIGKEDTSFTIPDGTETLGYGAFAECKKLSSIEIPDSVITVGDGAFSGCENLTNVIIPDSVETIGNSAFSDCFALSELSLGNSVTKIGYNAFKRCDNLTHATLGDNVVSIGEEAFGVCYSLESITVSKNNTAYKSIDGNLYTKDGKTLIQYATAKEDRSFTIPDGVTSIDRVAFFNCDSLTSVEIPDSLTSIASCAFEGCSSLRSIVIPNNVTSIGHQAFNYCYKLVEVINKSSLNIVAGSEDNGFIGYYAIEVHKGESKIVNQDDYLFYTYNGTNYLVNYIGEDTELILPESYNGESYEIYDYAFYRCRNLTSIVIPDSVTTVGE